MNIIFVIYRLGTGGAERVSVLLAEYLKEQGHNVSVLVYRNDGSYEINNNIPVVKMPDSSNFFLKHIKRIFFFFKYAKDETDLVITLYRGYDFTWLYRKFSKSKLILSQRNDPKAEYDNNISARIQCKLFFNGADAVVFQTREEMEYFNRSIRKKGVLIPNPVKQDLPTPYSGEREKVIVNFCRLTPQKNLKLLIDSFERIHYSYPDYCMRIYGDGEQKEELERYIRTKGLSEKVKILPFSKEIHTNVRRAAMYVSSSDYEGISNSMLEAMALGIPCICTDCPAGGARMVIKNGINGILVPVGDISEMVKAMKKLIENPNYSKYLGKEAEKIRETFSIQKICNKWEKLIEILMAEK